MYGTAHGEHKLEFLSELSHFCSSSKEHFLVGGDFNFIRYANERNKNSGVHRYTGLFNSLIHTHELRELTMNGGMFTWTNNQDPPILEKLDRLLTAKEWEDFFPLAMVKKLPRDLSDHNPLIILTGDVPPSKTIQFRFELSRLHNPEFYIQVEKIWNKPCMAVSIIDKI